MFGRLRPCAPFDFALSCAAAAAGSAATLGAWDGGEYRRVVVDDLGEAHLLRLRSCGVVERPEIEWRIHSGATRLGSAQATALVRTVLDADSHLPDCYAAFARDEVLAAAGRHCFGLRVLRPGTVYECLLATVLGQRLGPAARDSLFSRFARRHGPRIEFDSHAHYGFPPAAALARLPPERLSPASPVQAAALIGIARAWEAGELLSDTLRALGPADAALRLAALRGVGVQGAEWILLRAGVFTDSLPADDAALRRAADRAYQRRGGCGLSALALRRRWRPLAPWRGYAAYYLLRSQSYNSL